MRSRTIAGLMLLGMLAACSPAPGESSDEASTTASIAESSAPSASADGSQPTLAPGAVADLEALIPDTIGGAAVTKSSMQGGEYLLTGDDPVSVKFIQDVGVSPDDIAVAFGYGFSVSGDVSTGGYVVAFRADGAGEDRLLSVFKASADAESETPWVWKTVSLGGKQVEVAPSPSEGGQPWYLYAAGDVLFLVLASDQALVEEVLRALP